MGCRRTSAVLGRALAWLLALCLMAPVVHAGTPPETFDDRPSAAAMIADAVVVRPLSLVGAVITTTAFVVTLPLSALGGNAGQAAESMVAEPFKFTFVRPLGDLD